MNETIGIDRSAPLAEGTQLKGGDYRIISTLGRGGFGVTYLAEQTGMQRNVCIKEFFPKDYYRRDEDTSRVVLEADSFGPMMARFKEKFLKEARTIARFKHPNIIAIYDIFEENDTAYYVMEYIEGRSLKSLIAAHGPLAEDVAVGYITQVASALDYVHSRNTVHLDVKPDNIMLSDEDDSAILIDFGLSKHYDGAGEQTSTTHVGISRGYAPMEQYQTSGVNTFRPATDIYSLGATLYTLVTGTVPPEASVVNDEGLPTLPKSLSAGVRAAIERAMQSRTKDRPQSIAEFMQLLNGNNAGGVVPPKKPVVPVTSKPTQKPTAPKKRSKWWLWLLLLAIVGGGVFAYLNSQPKDNPEPTDKSMTIVADTIEEVDSVDVDAPIVEPEPTPAPDPVLRLTSNSRVTVEHGGGNGTIRYSLENPVSGVSISVSDDASWLTTSRSGNAISYSASANESQSSRTATITVSYGSQSFEVAITQSGKPAPSPDPVLSLTSNSRVTVEHSGGNGTIRYSLENPASGVNLSVSDDASWLTTSISGNTINYSASANESQSSRTATITVSYGGQSFEVAITQSGKPDPTRGVINGHEWVDLGLPSGLKWATCNVGASNPGDYGNYYAWGETSTKSSYTEDNCATWEQNIGDIAGTSRDAARQNWGGSWRMPRASEIDELLNHCTWTWTTQNGRNGYKVTGPNGNSIFLPAAAGYRYRTSSYYVGTYSTYWSSTPYESTTVRAYILYCGSGGGRHYRDWNYRGEGRSVRPVSE